MKTMFSTQEQYPFDRIYAIERNRRPGADYFVLYDAGGYFHGVNFETHPLTHTQIKFLLQHEFIIHAYDGLQGGQAQVVVYHRKEETVNHRAIYEALWQARRLVTYKARTSDSMTDSGLLPERVARRTWNNYSKGKPGWFVELISMVNQSYSQRQEDDAPLAMAAYTQFRDAVEKAMDCNGNNDPRRIEKVIKRLEPLFIEFYLDIRFSRARMHMPVELFMEGIHILYTFREHDIADAMREIFDDMVNPWPDTWDWSRPPIDYNICDVRREDARRLYYGSQTV